MYKNSLSLILFSDKKAKFAQKEVKFRNKYLSEKLYNRDTA